MGSILRAHTVSQMRTPDKPIPPAPPEKEAPLTSKSRLSGLRKWLSKRADTSIARLALLWFRRYFEASRNSGAAAAAYVSLSVLPGGLVFIALFNRVRRDENAFAERLIAHMRLDGQTASLVRDLFGTTSDNLVAAAITIVIGFLVWGLSIGQLYQDVYARAWRIEVDAPTDQLFYVIFFFVFSLAVRADVRHSGGAPGSRLVRGASGVDHRVVGLLALGPCGFCFIARSRCARCCPGRCWRPSFWAGLSPPRRSG